MLNNTITSLVRTWVPMAVGLLATFLAEHLHFVLSGDTQKGLIALTTAGVSAAYYLLVRLLEQKVPSIGWLLGHPAKPVYAQLQADGSHLITDLAGDFTSTFDPLAIEGNDPHTPGASAPLMPVASGANVGVAAPPAKPDQATAFSQPQPPTAP
jgi:hypothetical protein